VFRILRHRLGEPDARSRPWALVFAVSATQIVFSSLPESFAFSALSLIIVFAVAAGPRPTEAVRVAAGVFSFGITVTNLAEGPSRSWPNSPTSCPSGASWRIWA
jgi:hypothetical protein